MRRLVKTLLVLAFIAVALVEQEYYFRFLDWLGPRWAWLFSWWFR